MSFTTWCACHAARARLRAEQLYQELVRQRWRREYQPRRSCWEQGDRKAPEAWEFAE